MPCNITYAVVNSHCISFYFTPAGTFVEHYRMDQHSAFNIDGRGWLLIFSNVFRIWGLH